VSSSGKERRARTRERPLVALLAAAALHAALFGLSRFGLSPHVLVPAVPLAAQVGQPIEVEIGSWTTLVDSPTTGGPQAAPSTQTVLEGPGLQRIAASVAVRQAPAASTRELPVTDGINGDGGSEVVRDTSSAESVAPVRRIDIWRSSAADRAAMLGALDTAPLDALPSAQPSIGLLREGLAESDTLTGVSRSSAAVSAAYESARRDAPATGIAVFELQTDDTGLVQHVRLLSAGSDYESWRRMGEGLEALLGKRHLRVPLGSKGLLTRLRVERGELAVRLSERHRTKRKAALGQAPLHRKEESDESTRASLSPGRLSPSLGVVVSGAGEAHPTRVVILTEQYR
jgi:hypothetical protein